MVFLVFLVFYEFLVITVFVTLDLTNYAESKSEMNCESVKIKIKTTE